MPPENDFDFVIVGAGISGLYTAFELVEKGYRVACIDKRDTYSRSQRIQLTNQILMDLEALEKYREGVNAFAQKIRKSKNSVELHELEEFFYTILSQYPKDCIVFKRPYTIQTLDLDKYSLNIENTKTEESETLTFQHLIGADGAHHSTANLVHAQRPDELKEYEAIQESPHQHVAVSFQFTSLSDVQFKKIQAAFEQKTPVWKTGHMNALKKLGWQVETCLPVGYFYADDIAQSFFFAGEVPKELQIKNDQTQTNTNVANWVTTVFRSLYDIPDNIPFNIKYQSTPSFFDTSVQKAQKASIALTENDDTHCFIQVGDALITPNYQIGSGAAGAFFLGKAITENLSEKKSPQDKIIFNQKEYSQTVRSYIKKVKNILNSKKEQNNQTLKTLNLFKPTEKELFSKIKLCIDLIDNEIARITDEPLEKGHSQPKTTAKIEQLTQVKTTIQTSLDTLKENGGFQSFSAIQEWKQGTKKWVPQLIKTAQQERSSSLWNTVFIALEILTVAPLITKICRASYDTAFKGRMFAIQKTKASKTANKIQDSIKTFNHELQNFATRSL